MVGAIDHALSYSLASLRARVSSTPLPSLPPPSFLDTVVRPRQDSPGGHRQIRSVCLIQSSRPQRRAHLLHACRS
jgi:hypothetical protein